MRGRLRQHKQVHCSQPEHLEFGDDNADDRGQWGAAAGKDLRLGADSFDTGIIVFARQQQCVSRRQKRERTREIPAPVYGGG